MGDINYMYTNSPVTYKDYTFEQYTIMTKKGQNVKEKN